MNNKIKALACADLHIDMNNRIEDTKLTLKRLAQCAISNAVSVVYIIGDIYERKRPYNIEKALFERWVKVLSEQDMEIIIIPGNHDCDKDGVSAVEEFAILKLPNISVKSNPCVTSLGNFDIFLGHFLVNGAKLGSHDFIAETNITPKSILDNYKADLYLLGDVHKKQLLHENPDMLYTGSPRRINFGERKETPSAVLIEAGTYLEYKWIGIEDRPMVQLSGEFNKGKLVFDKEVEPGSIVKAVISCKREQYDTIDESKIIEQFSHTESFKIEYNIEREDRVRNTHITESSTTIQAFQNYAAEAKLSKDIIKIGLDIINTKRS